MIAGVVSTGFSLLVGRLSQRRRVALALSDDGKKISACMHTLNVCTYDEKLTFFRDVLSKLNISAYIKDDHLLLFGGKKLLPLFSPSAVTEGNLFFLTRKLRSDKKPIIILSARFTAEAYLFAKEINVVLFDGEQVYNLLKLADRLPKSTASDRRNSPTAFFKRIFIKSNGVKFILFGLSFIVMAFMVFYPLYYYIVGGIFIVFGLIALFFASPVDKPTHVSLVDYLKSNP